MKTTESLGSRILLFLLLFTLNSSAFILCHSQSYCIRFMLVVLESVFGVDNDENVCTVNRYC